MQRDTKILRNANSCQKLGCSHARPCCTKNGPKRTATTESIRKFRLQTMQPCEKISTSHIHCHSTWIINQTTTIGPPENWTHTNCMQERLYCITNLFNVAYQTSVKECISLPERLQRNNSSKTDLTQVSNEKKSKCVYSSIVGSKTKKNQKHNNPHHQSIKPC